MTGLKIVGTGRYLPPKIVTNDDMAKIVETSDEWITTRTGIKTRHWAQGDENVITMGTEAGKQAIADAGLTPDQIGGVVVSTYAADYATPSAACVIAKNLGLPHDIPAFDLNAACSGFVYGLKVVNGLLLQEKKYKYMLLVSSEMVTRTTDFTDRSTCILFGDGAGAVVVTPHEGLFETYLASDGNDQVLCCPGPCAAHPEKRLFMDGHEVYKFAVGALPDALDHVIDQAGLTREDVDLFVCHQANKRILDTVIKKYGLPPERFYVNIQDYGNISSACIPIALDELNRQGRLTPGMKIAMAGFGGGLTWAGALLEW